MSQVHLIYEFNTYFPRIHLYVWLKRRKIYFCSVKGNKTETYLSCCQSDKIFHSLGHNFSKETNHNSANIFISNPHIKEDLRVVERQSRRL